MSKVTTRAILGESKNILRDANHFVSIPVKVPVANAPTVDGVKVVVAGTIITKAGAVVAHDATELTTPKASAAFGIVLEDWGFEGVATGGNEAVPTVIHGIVLESALAGTPSAEVIGALKNIVIV